MLFFRHCPMRLPSVAFAAAAGVALLSLSFPPLLPRLNVPRLIFRAIFLHLAPLKERILPSDSAELSPEMRGVAWVLNATPPPPHDVGSIRTMVDGVWPRIWDEPDGVGIEEVPTGALFRPADGGDGGGGGGGSDGGDGAGGMALLFLHGGGLVSGTPRTESGVSAEISLRCRCPVLSANYRVIPESTLEEAVSDAVTAFDWLTDAFPGRRVGVVGGSAGGALALLGSIELRDRARRGGVVGAGAGGDAAGGRRTPAAPAAAALLSPGPGFEFLTDPPCLDWPSLESNAGRDGFMKGGFYQYVRGVVFSDRRNVRYLRDRLGDLSDLPPTLVSAGGYEVILDGVRALRDAMSGAGTSVAYREYPRMQHVHHALFFVAGESDDALGGVAGWLRDATLGA